MNTGVADAQVPTRDTSLDAEPVTDTDKQQILLCFDASMSSPNYTAMFMECGGQLDAVAVRWQSDFAVTGAAHSTVVTFPHTKTISVELEIPEAMVTYREGRVVLPTDLRLNTMEHRTGASINGTLVHSLAGESSAHIYSILDNQPHFQMGSTYKTFQAHSSTLAISGAHIKSRDANGNCTHRQCEFKNDADNKKMLSAAVKLAEGYVGQGSELRSHVVYEPSPMLTKTVYSEITGIDGCGYSLLHCITSHKAYTTLATLNALYETAIGLTLNSSEPHVEAFKSATASPGLQAAKCAATIATATSLIVNVLMSYRADGVNVVLPRGAGFVPIENWNASEPRDFLTSDDCDGAANLAITLIRTALDSSADGFHTHRYLSYVRNAVFPHYQVALSVLGATAAEATSADESHSTIAGHAIAVLVPTVSFLRAIARSSGKRIGKDGPEYLDNPISINHDEAHGARFDAFFPEATVGEMPSDEHIDLSSWDAAKEKFNELTIVAIEGTTPAVSTMYVSDTVDRINEAKSADLDKAVFCRAAPNVFRSIKRLHTGRHGGCHTFYSELLELTFASDSPLWTNPVLREMNIAATQFVLYSDTDSAEITSAGASPRSLAMEQYGALPLVSVSAMAASVLDLGEKHAKMNVMPPRVPGPTKLDDYQCESLNKSMQHVERLQKLLSNKSVGNTSTDGQHRVAYICAFNTLVYNPRGVGQFVDKLDLIATSGEVRATTIPGMAQDQTGQDVGVFLHIEIYSPV